MKRTSRQAAIPLMVGRLVEQFHPDRIILFGSVARGDAAAGSDVDLLVVATVDGSKRALQCEMRRALQDIPIPKDIIVTTPDDFDWRKDTIGTIEYPAVREGKVLYARN
jgi:uncharacterized protein